MKFIYAIGKIVLSAAAMTAAVLWYIDGDLVMTMLFAIAALLILKD